MKDNTRFPVNHPVNKLGPVPEGFKAKERDGETIEGGWFVARRGRVGKRLKIADRPFEHPDIDSAIAEMRRLKEKYPEGDFRVIMEVPLGKIHGL